ncbi:hypothetical protein BGP_4979 [Beggiatoa sp. PS]|nr:hypothetical protein BGP_4979 [Beggiatoa sp. PS]
MNPSNYQSSNLLTPLKNSYIFNHIHEDILETLSTELISISLSEGETLFQQDEPSDALYIILKGLLKATLTQVDGHQIVLGEMEAGEIVGEIHLLAERRFYK